MAIEDTVSGAGQGAALGGAIFPGWGHAIGGLAGGALGAFAGGAGSRNKPTPMQQKKQELIDQLLASVNGNGPYSDLFNANEADFQKRFAEPMRNRFKNEIAPEIQQQYIKAGQHRGTGLEDSLTRAGVDLDNLINQHYMNYQNQANQNKIGGINTILGADNFQPEQNWLDAGLQGLAGYANTPQFGKGIQGILAGFDQPKEKQNSPRPARKGFESDISPTSSAGVPLS